MLDLCELPRSTFQNWARAGLVERDPGGAYGEGALLELVLVAALRGYFSVEELSIRWPRLRAGGEVAEFVSRGRLLGGGERYDLVIELKHGGIYLAVNDEQLVAAVRHPQAPRAIVVMDLAPTVLLARESFRSWSVTDRRPTERKVGRPSRQPAEVRKLHGT